MSVVRGELGRAGTWLRADWKLIAAPGGLNLAKLTLTVLESDASAEGLYTRADLNNVSVVRFAMYRLWGDLLREKGRRQAAALQPAGVGE